MCGLSSHLAEGPFSHGVGSKGQGILNYDESYVICQLNGLKTKVTVWVQFCVCPYLKINNLIYQYLHFKVVYIIVILNCKYFAVLKNKWNFLTWN